MKSDSTLVLSNTSCQFKSSELGTQQSAQISHSSLRVAHGGHSIRNFGTSASKALPTEHTQSIHVHTVQTYHSSQVGKTIMHEIPPFFPLLFLLSLPPLLPPSINQL